MNKENFRKHCEEQIERCIKLNDSKHLKEHELALGLLNENESLIKKNKKYKEAIEKVRKEIENSSLEVNTKEYGLLIVCNSDDLLQILDKA